MQFLFLFRVSSSAFPLPRSYRFSVSVSGTYQKDRQ